MKDLSSQQKSSKIYSMYEILNNKNYFQNYRGVGVVGVEGIIRRLEQVEKNIPNISFIFQSPSSKLKKQDMDFILEYIENYKLAANVEYQAINRAINSLNEQCRLVLNFVDGNKNKQKNTKPRKVPKQVVANNKIAQFLDLDKWK